MSRIKVSDGHLVKVPKTINCGRPLVSWIRIKMIHNESKRVCCFILMPISGRHLFEQGDRVSRNTVM